VSLVSAGIGVECYNTAVIGDITEQEARDFLVQQPDISNIDDEEDWQTVYKAYTSVSSYKTTLVCCTTDTYLVSSFK
jgi:hypothetical protein